MRRIRKWLLAAAMAVLLTLSFAGAVSADPGDTGWDSSGGFAVSSDPGDTGWMSADPGDTGW